MFEKELTPPPDGRLSSSSGSPDSVYKSSTDSSRSRKSILRFSLNFSPDNIEDPPSSAIKNKTSTACKYSQKAVPKFKLDDDSDFEWDQSLLLASPQQKRPPSVRKIHRTRSRLDPSEIPGLVRCRLSNSVTKSKESRPARPPPLSSPLTTPPHKKLRALQINADVSRSASSPMGPRASPLRSKKFSPRGSLFTNGRRSLKSSPANACPVKKPSINPFTPNRTVKTINRINKVKGQYNSDSGYSDDSWLLDVGKGDTTDIDMDTDEFYLDLTEISTNRYKEEFCEESLIGSGEFGNVFKCVNKLDGCTYAIKRSREPVAGRALARVNRNEVYAEAVLGKHAHVVRYHSAWAEAGHLYIQNEFCNGGSLAEEISVHQKRGTRFTEVELKEILRQIAQGLKYIHCLMLAHMDIKPGNIFIQYNHLITQSPESGIEEDISNDSEMDDEVTYKIGDFGHVTQIFSPCDLEEGDCRYLPKEILSDNHDHLVKADIFALGLTIYQSATLAELPKNGVEWHAIREGKLPYMTGYSVAFNNLVKSMVDPIPLSRPTAAAISIHPVLCPEHLKTRLELTKALNEEIIKNQRLSEQLRAVTEHVELRSFSNNFLNVPRPNTRASRLVGLKVNRSKSLTNF